MRASNSSQKRFDNARDEDPNWTGSLLRTKNLPTFTWLGFIKKFTCKNKHFSETQRVKLPKLLG